MSSVTFPQPPPAAGGAPGRSPGAVTAPAAEQVAGAFAAVLALLARPPVVPGSGPAAAPTGAAGTGGGPAPAEVTVPAAPGADLPPPAPPSGSPPGGPQGPAGPIGGRPVPAPAVASTADGSAPAGTGTVPGTGTRPGPVVTDTTPVPPAPPAGAPEIPTGPAGTRIHGSTPQPPPTPTGPEGADHTTPVPPAPPAGAPEIPTGPAGTPAVGTTPPPPPTPAPHTRPGPGAAGTRTSDGMPGAGDPHPFGAAGPPGVSGPHAATGQRSGPDRTGDAPVAPPPPPTRSPGPTIPTGPEGSGTRTSDGMPGAGDPHPFGAAGPPGVSGPHAVTGQWAGPDGTGDAPVTGPADLGARFVDVARALRRDRDGSWRLNVRLDPPELGRLEVTITSRRGEIHVAVTASDDAGARAVLAQRDGIRQTLAEAGFRLGGFSLSDGRPGGAGTEERPRHRWSRALTVTADREVPADDGALRL